MERTQIINELRRFEVTGEQYNNIPPTRGEKYYIDILDQQHNEFFDDLRFFIANNSKETVSLYITQTLEDLVTGKKQLDKQLSSYLQEREGNDTIYIRSMNAIQKDYINKMECRLSNTLNILLGRQTYHNSEVKPQQVSLTDTYKDLLANYDDLLTIKDLVTIFKTTRQTIHNWEMDGKIQRTNPNGHPRFLKSSIKRIIIENFPELIQQYQKEKYK